MNYVFVKFLVKVAEWPPVWERADHTVYRAYISWTAINLHTYMYFFPLGFEAMVKGFDCISFWLLLNFLLLKAFPICRNGSHVSYTTRTVWTHFGEELIFSINMDNSTKFHLSLKFRKTAFYICGILKAKKHHFIAD